MAHEEPQLQEMVRLSRQVYQTFMVAGNTWRWYVLTLISRTHL